MKPSNSLLEVDQIKTFQLPSPPLLECGEQLDEVHIAYHTFGTLNETKSNVVWVFHALTANSNPTEWWPGLVGEDDLINPNDHFIVCANMLGSCYGSTGPKDKSFPLITIKDMVSAHQQLHNHLSLGKIYLGIGGSMGGQQLLEWAVQEPHCFEHIVPLATNAFHSPWGIAFNEAQRMALDNIDTAKGLETARAIAMLSYRHYDTYHQSQQDVDLRWDQFSAASYQRYQGEKLRKRFDYDAYYCLSKAMDSHHIGRHFGSAETALHRIQSKALVIGIDTDVLFPIAEQEFIHQHLRLSKLSIITSTYGHDGFLTESKKISTLLKDFLS